MFLFDNECATLVKAKMCMGGCTDQADVFDTIIKAVCWFENEFNSVGEVLLGKVDFLVSYLERFIIITSKNYLKNHYICYHFSDARQVREKYVLCLKHPHPNPETNVLAMCMYPHPHLCILFAVIHPFQLLTSIPYNHPLQVEYICVNFLK